MTQIAVLLVGLLPGCRAKNVLLGLLVRGSSIHRTARIQPVLLWRVRCLRLGARAYMGPGSVFRDLRRLEIDDDAEIGQFNWISAAGQHITPADETMWASLVLRPHSSITSRHYVDCSGGVRLEKAAVIGGVRSTVLSHSMEVDRWVQTARPVVLGRSSVLFATVTVTAGCIVASDCVVAAGAVVAKDLAEPGRLYGGVPAKVIGDVSASALAGREISRDVSREAVRERLAVARQARP